MSIKYLWSDIRSALRGWWRNRIAVYYVHDPQYGSLQQQLERLVVAPRHRWRCRPRMIVGDIEHLEHLSIPPHIDLLADRGTYGSITITGDASMSAVGSSFVTAKGQFAVKLGSENKVKPS